MAGAQEQKKDESFPTALKSNGEVIMSQSKIVNTIAEHFDAKVRDTIKHFNTDTAL